MYGSMRVENGFALQIFAGRNVLLSVRQMLPFPAVVKAVASAISLSVARPRAVIDLRRIREIVA